MSRLIDIITNDPKQDLKLILEDGSKLQLKLVYIENQQGWFYSFIHPKLTVNNRRLVNSPNMLRQFRDIINFGLCCIVSDGSEPIFLDDFKNKRALFYTLNSTDVTTVEEFLSDQV